MAKKFVPIKDPSQQFQIKYQTAKEGTGGYLFEQTPQGNIEAQIYIGPNTDLTRLEKEVYPKLFGQYMGIFPTRQKPPEISFFDNELSNSSQELWEVLSVRRRYLGAILALCRFQGSAQGVKFLSLGSISALCNCLLGKEVNVVLEWLDADELYKGMNQFLVEEKEVESLSCALPPQSWSEKEQ